MFFLRGDVQIYIVVIIVFTQDYRKCSTVCCCLCTMHIDNNACVKLNILYNVGNHLFKAFIVPGYT